MNREAEEQYRELAPKHRALIRVQLNRKPNVKELYSFNFETMEPVPFQVPELYIDGNSTFYVFTLVDAMYLVSLNTNRILKYTISCEL